MGHCSCGNLHRGQPLLQPRILSTEFEMQVERMGSSQSQFFASAELKHWCALNRSRVCVPQWLLDAWRLSVDVTPSGSRRADRRNHLTPRLFERSSEPGEIWLSSGIMHSASPSQRSLLFESFSAPASAPMPVSLDVFRLASGNTSDV